MFSIDQQLPPERGTPEAVIHLARLATALAATHPELVATLIHLAVELNGELSGPDQVQPATDPRCKEQFLSASTEQLRNAAWIAIGAYTETEEQRSKSESRRRAFLMLERYFVWCRSMAEQVDLLEKSKNHPSHINATPFAHAYKIGAFVGHWLAALCPVIEGWEELKLEDPDIDALLAEGTSKDYRTRLSRFRNGVFHFQKRNDDPRFVDFMDEGEDARIWAIKLEREFERFFTHHAASGYVHLFEWLRR